MTAEVGGGRAGSRAVRPKGRSHDRVSPEQEGAFSVSSGAAWSCHSSPPPPSTELCQRGCPGGSNTLAGGRRCNDHVLRFPPGSPRGNGLCALPPSPPGPLLGPFSLRTGFIRLHNTCSSPLEMQKVCVSTRRGCIFHAGIHTPA